VDAEAARVAGDAAGAIDAYERAIDAARENDFPHHAAIASELAARFHLSPGRVRLARVAMGDAALGFQRWGAVAQAQRLRPLHPQLLPALAVPERIDVTRSSSSSSSVRLGGATLGMSTTSGGVLDMTSLMKAATAIAGEIVKERLHRLLIGIMVENA